MQFLIFQIIHNIVSDLNSSQEIKQFLNYPVNMQTYHLFQDIKF